MTKESNNHSEETVKQQAEKPENAESEAVTEDVVASEQESATQDSVEQVVEELSQEQQKIADLEQKLAAAQATIDGQKDSVIRAKAEVDNIRRRSAQDVEKAKKFALEKFAGELLVVVDNLERGLENIDREDESNKAMLEGIELTLQSFLTTLDKFGVNVVDPKDQPFNPELHQAMSIQEVEGVEPNTVIAVMQKGYELNGRLLRPAMVMVSKA
ncbi:nucleotide exchange factor GrpE [Thalassotalea mangrovi]|uniref:Protein GrpE n=1 Tax=Thalassotalea mangrovi TaxID=2572245 RepID=A0A4U1B484_9GAMM|nr:nucleotide exchange factor GrpE [Thalassotalea mangrovi]TKB45073.1 nucleotide exchange factor GrpE [Thalassotalea mangrovi]